MAIEIENHLPMRIFLSYGHDSNEELVRRIKANLEKRGHDVWFDKSEIKGGHDWRRSITEGIIDSNRVLSFLSKYSTRYPGVCLDEIAIAIGVKGGNIQTILVESEEEVKPPPSISHIQWLDMHDWKEKRAAGEAVWEKWYQEKLAEIVRVVESDESRRFAGEIKTLEDYLKPISSDSRIFHLLKKGLVGRVWLVDAIEKWRNAADRASRLFWIMGAPGVGKSAFAAHLAHYGRDKVIAVQFCEYDKPDHRNAHRIVRTLAFQIATRLPDYRKLLLTLPEITDLERKNPNELFDYLLANPLRHAIDGGRDRYLIVIDALDEAGANGRNELVEMLARNAPRLPDWIGFVVTSRPVSNVIAPLQGLNPFVLDTATESNRADIRDYLRHELFLHLQNRPNADRLVEQILEKSEGVFLYAERFCNDVQRGYLSLDRPEQFPQGLGGIFIQYFQRQFPDLEKFRKDVRPALRAILAAREPLPVEILQCLFNWHDEDLRDFTRTLGSIFPVATEAGHEVIKPYHKSLADWLADQAKAGTFFVSEVEGHCLLADAGFQQFRASRELASYYADYLLAHIWHAQKWDQVDLLLNDDTFLRISSGYIRRWLPQILATWPTDRAADSIIHVPERYVHMCKVRQSSEYIPEGLIPSDALGTIMHRPDGKRRYRKEFIVTVEAILTLFSRSLDLATSMTKDPRFGPTQLRDIMVKSRGFKRMADAVWDRDLEELSGTLANLSNFVKRDWEKGIEILAQARMPLDDDNAR